MKNKSVFILLILFVTSCAKTKTPPPALGTVPVKFTTTVYQTLAPFNDSGLPANLETPDAISNDLLNFVKNTLPNGVNLNTTRPDLLSSTAIPDIKITNTTTLYMTFVSGVTNFSDAIGIYTYPTNNPPASAADIKKVSIVFANAGNGTPLKPGDKVNIGTFEAGTSVGFVLLQNGWNNLGKSINYDAVHFCSNDVLNPEVSPDLKKHAVLINYTPESKVLIGFEDLDRTERTVDSDFNDVVFFISKVTK
jgi:hypothetical protein